MEVSQAVDFIKNAIATQVLDWALAVEVQASYIVLKNRLSQEEWAEYHTLVDNTYISKVSTIIGLLPNLPETSTTDYTDKFDCEDVPSKKHAAWKVHRLSKEYPYLKALTRQLRLS